VGGAFCAERILIKFFGGIGVAQGPVVAMLMASWIAIWIHKFCKEFFDAIIWTDEA